MHLVNPDPGSPGSDRLISLKGATLPFLPYLRGEVDKGPQDSYFYFGMDSSLNTVRWKDFKAHFNFHVGPVNKKMVKIYGRDEL